MGYSWIYLFHPDFSFAGMDFSLLFNSQLVFRSYMTSLALIIAVYLGMQIGDIPRKNRPPSLFRQLVSKVNINQKWSDKSYRNIGLMVLLISLPLRIYTDTTRIGLGQQYDYLATFDFQLNGYLSMLADLYIVGVVLLMIYFRHKKVVSSLLLVSTSTYLLFSMTSGSRGMAMINIVILFFIYNLCVYKFKKITLAALMIAGIIMGSYLTSIGLNRIADTPAIDGDKDIAARFLQEFGGTQLTMILAMDRMDTSAPTYGSTYIASLATILPNISPSIDNYIKENNFQLKLNYPTIGGSYLAELYYNFGQLSCLIAFVIGYLLSRFERLMLSLKDNHKYILFAIMVLMARQALWWLRDSSYVFPRYIIEGLVVLIMVVFLLKVFKLIKTPDPRINMKVSA